MEPKGFVMSAAQIIIAGCLVVLGLAHSALGESDILRPLFAQEWRTPTPRWALERILRFAWHLTSIAWFALAAIVLGASILPVVGVMCITSAGIIFVMLRGHLAWPLFLLAGVTAFFEEGLIGERTLTGASIASAIGLTAAAGVHVYWAAGGRWMHDRALPPIENSDFKPGPVLTLAVALALGTFASLVIAAAFDAGPKAVSWLVAAGVAVLTIRAIGDTKVAGFTKSIRNTPFAIADDRYFTPLIVFLALGASSSLLA